MLLLIFLVGFVVWLITLPATYRVTESININTSIEKAFKYILQMDNHIVWSPWLMHANDVDVQYSDNLDQVGSYYSWDHQMLGSGKLTNSAIVPNANINQDLEFYKPFKSQAKILWTVVANQADGVTVTWQMDGGMPLFLRWLIPNIKNMIGHDYQIGLLRLAGKIDETVEPFELEWLGEVEQESIDGICKNYTIAMQKLPEMFTDTIPKLQKFIEQQQLTSDGKSFGVYHDIHDKKGVANMKVFMSASGTTAHETYTIPAGKYYRVVYNGQLERMSLVWHAATQHLQMLKLKMNTNMPCLAEYSDTSLNQNQSVKVYLSIPLK